ncbi:hypothetical protein TGARI_316180B, partial [Toxoplasma gondii ARI]
REDGGAPERRMGRLAQGAALASAVSSTGLGERERENFSAGLRGTDFLERREKTQCRDSRRRCRNETRASRQNRSCSRLH